MSERLPPATQSEMLQILATEHTNLQAVRSGTIFEANGRTTLFLGTVSGAVVALAFVGQVSDMDSTFLTFALILLPSLIFVGAVTFVRVYQVGVEDMIAARGINRIRHFYTEFAPELEMYFIHSAHDDMRGFMHNMGAHVSRWQQLLSTAGLVGVLTGVLTAVFTGLLTAAVFQATAIGCLAAGIVAFMVCIVLCLKYMERYLRATEQHLKTLFPSHGPEKT
jgi:hypothetical protein